MQKWIIWSNLNVHITWSLRSALQGWRNCAYPSISITGRRRLKISQHKTMFSISFLQSRSQPSVSGSMKWQTASFWAPFKVLGGNTGQDFQLPKTYQESEAKCHGQKWSHCWDQLGRISQYAENIYTSWRLHIQRPNTVLQYGATVNMPIKRMLS